MYSEKFDESMFSLDNGQFFLNKAISSFYGSFSENVVRFDLNYRLII